MELLDEIIQRSFDENEKVSGLVRRLKLAVGSANFIEISDWAEKELGGYDGTPSRNYQNADRRAGLLKLKTNIPAGR